MATEIERNDDLRHYEEYYALLNGEKELYTKQDVKRILDYIHGKYLGKSVEIYWNQAKLLEKNKDLEQEHAKSLALLIENESQKLQLEILNEKLKEAYKTLEENSKKDALTNLVNRKALIDIFEMEFKRAKRAHEKMQKFLKLAQDNVADKEARSEDDLLGNSFGHLACALLDVDHFKNINDTYGHLSGDDILRRIGEFFLAPEAFRLTDTIGRYGGDEFLLILPGTDARQAAVPLEKFLQKIRATMFPAEKGELLRLTLSAGVSEFHHADAGIKDLIARADKALYRAKQEGRDKLIIDKSIFCV